MKIDESPHPADILSKPLQRREVVYTRARILGLEGGVPTPPKAQSGDAVDLETTTQEPAELDQHSAIRRKEAAAPAGAGMAAQYERLALGSAPCAGAGRPDGPAAPGHAREAMCWRGQD